MADTKITLQESQIPSAWYNVIGDMPEAPGPPLHPGTKAPLGPDDLAPLFPMSLIGQEVSSDRWIDIPGEVMDVYRLWRPSPLFRAARLERELGTPAHIYYKYEGVSPVGSHKPNTAVPQAFYNKQDGTKRLATETGAGQWGSALAMACNLFGLECTVYMVKVSYHQKPYRRVLMETYGATVHASPSNLTNAGRGILEQDPDSNGSLGISISEAVEDAATHDDTHYALGSVLNHVLLHQSVVGLEAQAQLDSVGEQADVVIGCVGGGSNFAGLSYPFLGEQFRGERSGLRALAAEPAACPTLTRGTYAYDYGDTAMMAPIVPMYTPDTRSSRPPFTPAGSGITAMRRRCPNSCWTGTWKPSPISRTRCSRRASSSRARRASSRLPKQPTR
jgi:tryptophan synthase beta chain